MQALPVLLAVLLAGCASPMVNKNLNQAGAPLRVLSLGDSYTIGETVSARERWPVLLADALRNDGRSVDDPIIIAHTGWTTDDLDQSIDDAQPEGTFDLVTLLIGVNNQYRGLSADDYHPRFTGLLRRAIAFAGGKASHVIVVSIPDWGVTPFAEGRDRAKIGREIEQFNTIAENEAAKAGARFVDITPISKRAASEPDLVATDGLHPSSRMYALWVEAILPEVLDAVKR